MRGVDVCIAAPPLRPRMPCPVVANAGGDRTRDENGLNGPVSVTGGD